MSSQKLKTKTEWKNLGFRVPTKAVPMGEEDYYVPGYRTVVRTRYLYGKKQVVAIDPEKAERRRLAAQKGVATRIKNMVTAIQTAQLTIVAGQTEQQIRDLARSTHGGNYRGKPGEFFWCDRVARNTIRHCLTNYEQLWGYINRGLTADHAYAVLRGRVDALVAETYPQYR